MCIRDSNYRLFYKPVGSERGLRDVYPTLVAKVLLFVEAVIADELTGAVDVTFGGITGFGIVPDPSDNLFWGCDIQINVLEFIN